MFYYTANILSQKRRGFLTMKAEIREKILVVDDEKPIRSLLVQILSQNGYVCCEAANTQEAKEQLKGQPFDLVLSDIRMPGKSGIDLCRHIKSEYPDVGVMLVTAVDDLETAREAIALDIFGYVLKPIDKTQISISVANAMKLHRFELMERGMRERLEETVREKTADLLKMNEDLKVREKDLREVNTALSVLLRKIEQEKEAIGERILENVHKCVLPYMERLRNSRLSESQQIDLDIAEKNIREVVSPFIKNISSPAFNLTHMEIQVANLVKQGMSTKEIASTMNLSVNTIMTHRAHIREKLNLGSTKESLYSCLTSLE
jgi:DNA-binding NarL/FixJ family response regulator